MIEAYLKGEGGYNAIARKFHIPNHSQVEKWVKMYKEVGEQALTRKNGHTPYTIQFKLDVIHYYLTSGDSLTIVASKYGLSDPSLISSWRKVLSEEGVNGLSKPKGRPPMSPKPKKKIEKNLTREQKLAHENELLRAELAFIKKLRGLRMNIPDRLKNEMHESSTNSEEHLN